MRSIKQGKPKKKKKRPLGFQCDFCWGREPWWSFKQENCRKKQWVENSVIHEQE